MINVFAVVGQHRDDPRRLLLLGQDGRYYAYDAAGRTTPVRLGPEWELDGGDTRTAPSPTGGSPTAQPSAVGSREGSNRWPRPVPLRPLHSAAALVALALALLGSLLFAPSAAAHAPALVTVVADAELRSEPSGDAAVLGTVGLGETVELTGAAAVGYLHVASGAEAGWVPENAVDAGLLATGAVVSEAMLRAEPRGDAPGRRLVPSGSAVLLTGAAVDGFLAASFEGTGGWLPADAIG